MLFPVPSYKVNKWGNLQFDVPAEWHMECRGNRDGMYFEVHKITPDEYVVFVDFHPETPESKPMQWGHFLNRYYSKGKNKGKLAQSARDAAWRSVD